MKIINKVLLILGIVFTINQTVYASEQEEVKELFLSKIETVVSIIKDDTITKEERNSKIVQLLTPTIDFEIMAKLSLGSKEWTKLNGEQKTIFVKLYVQRMKQSYSSKLDAYSGQEIAVTNILQPKPNRIELVTNIVNPDNNLEINYKYYKPAKQEEGKDSWLIYDVEILGISILKTDRAQFSEFLQTKTIDDLITRLSDS
jgi:phospholipid transport system substrate-binding protein